MGTNYYVNSAGEASPTLGEMVPYAPISGAATGALTGNTLRRKFTPNLDWFRQNWSKGKGLTSHNISKWGNVAGGIAQGMNAIGGISNYKDAIQNKEDLTGDILRMYGSNPIANNLISESQINDIRKLKNGTYNEAPSLQSFFSNMFGGLGKAIPSTLMGLAIGGIPGAAIQGIGSLVNSGISGMAEDQNKYNQDLSQLYNDLMNAEMQYKSMRRIPLKGFGLQQQYVDQFR